MLQIYTIKQQHPACALLIKAAGLLQGQADYQSLQMKPVPSKRGPLKQHDSIHDYRDYSAVKKDWRWEKIVQIKIVWESMFFFFLFLFLSVEQNISLI